MSSSDQFNAASSMAGYLFQCRLALLRGLHLVPKSPNAQISIEKFDDISLHGTDIAECFIQAKHHIEPKPLNDKSVELWTTFRVWINQFSSGIVSAADSRYMLLTTGTADDGSAMSFLRAGANQKSRCIAKELLVSAARTSTNMKSKKGRDAFLALNDEEIDAFLSRVELVDQHPNLVDVMSEVENILALVSPKHSAKVAAYLEGWWIGVVGKCLLNEGGATIPVQNIITKAHEIGKMFGEEVLPIDDRLRVENKQYSMDDESSMFVKQMRIVEVGDSVVKRGVHDFYRASAQRSKWARENLLLDGEAAKYDHKLKDIFERRSEAESAETPSPTEVQAKAIGRKLCLWASQQSLDFRNVVEAWMTAGSYHGLADRMEIGWHPSYSEILSDLSEVEDA